MKNIRFIILALLAFLSFYSCASNQVVSEPANKNNKHTEEKLRFDDWKYKGFGKELPFWIEPALNGDMNTLKKMVLELADSSVVKILIGAGENSDQAEQSAKEQVKALLVEDSDFVIYDNFWVLENEKSLAMPYVAIYIYYKQ